MNSVEVSNLTNPFVDLPTPYTSMPVQISS